MRNSNVAYTRRIVPEHQQLHELYEAFNNRDIDRVLQALSPEVDWPNAWQGGRLVGHEAVRDYWRRQWAEIDPHVEPVSISNRAGGEVAVEVHQVVRSLNGEMLSDGRVVHVYEFRDGLVVRMDVES